MAFVSLIALLVPFMLGMSVGVGLGTCKNDRKIRVGDATYHCQREFNKIIVTCSRDASIGMVGDRSTNWWTVQRSLTYNGKVEPIYDQCSLNYTKPLATFYEKSVRKAVRKLHELLIEWEVASLLMDEDLLKKYTKGKG